MKKLLIVVLIIVIINFMFNLVISNKSSRSWFVNNSIDTLTHKVLIDSVQYNINVIDCTIININSYEQKVIDKANSLNNDSAVLLFKELVSDSFSLPTGKFK